MGESENKELLQDFIMGSTFMLLMLIIVMIVLTFKYNDLREKYNQLAVRTKRIETYIDVKKREVDTKLILEGDEP